MWPQVAEARPAASLFPFESGQELTKRFRTALSAPRFALIARFLHSPSRPRFSGIALFNLAFGGRGARMGGQNIR